MILIQSSIRVTSRMSGYDTWQHVTKRWASLTAPISCSSFWPIPLVLTWLLTLAPHNVPIAAAEHTMQHSLATNERIGTHLYSSCRCWDLQSWRISCWQQQYALQPIYHSTCEYHSWYPIILFLPAEYKFIGESSSSRVKKMDSNENQRL